MNPAALGPPEKEAGPHGKDPANAESYDTNTSTAKPSGIGAREPGTTPAWVPCTWSHPQNLNSQLHRRHEAARRLPLLCERCGAADPIVCQCWEPDPPLSERALNAWRAAIERTLPIGPALVPIEVLQQLWRNGGPDREVAERAWSETKGIVA